jgi:hypothetical protein
LLGLIGFILEPLEKNIGIQEGNINIAEIDRISFETTREK